MDYSLFKAVNGLSGNSVFDDVMTFLAKDLPAVLVVLVALTFLVPFARHRRERRNGAVLGTLAAPLALLVAQPISHLVDRARPYISHPGHAHLLITRSPDPSFPSDHATGAFALAFAVWLYDRTIGTGLLILAFVLSLARVYVGTHYPGDVLAGAALGMVTVALLYWVTPARRLIEALAQRCGDVWDRMTGRWSRRPASAVRD